MRWNDTITLIGSAGSHQDEIGSWKDGDSPKTEVFCDTYSVGSSTRSVAVDAGLRADAQVKVRSCDYSNEGTVIYRGIYYDVESVTDKGDFVILQLGRRITNE